METVKRLSAFCVCLAIICLSSCRSAAPAADNYRNYYEIFVGSFYDSNGDGVGDLNGVTQKLDYIRNDVGADGIWLTPINPSPSYHKYDITNYNDIDPQFGTLSDFDGLIAGAHKRDMRVLLDLVVQHTSVNHPWFTEAVKALQSGGGGKYVDYYRFADAPQAGYSEYGDTGVYYAAVFSPDMPDLNTDNPAVRAEIADIMSFWLNRGADGFRLDAATSFYPGSAAKNTEFLKWLNGACKAVKPGAYLVGEVWSGANDILSYYGSGIDSFFNYPFATVTGVVNADIKAKNGAALSAKAQKWDEDIHKANPNAQDAPFISNHDNPRPAGYLMRDPAMEKLSAAVYLLLPGCPFIYYGEEIGMVGSGDDPNKRMPMLWFSQANNAAGIANPPPGGNYDESAVVPVDSQLKDPGSVLNFYKSVLMLKAKYPAVARGVYTAVKTGDKSVYAFCDAYKNAKIYIFINFDSAAHTESINAMGISDAVQVRETLLIRGGDAPALTSAQLSLPPFTVALLQ